MTHYCPECGAAYERDDDSCGARFGTLLSLDHSRQEPWGSRHGQAFAAFALQHPKLHAARRAMPALTIADLDDFSADSYAERLDAWCDAALRSWGLGEG